MYLPSAFNHTTPWYEHTRLCTSRWIPGLAQNFVQTLCVLFQVLSLKHDLQVCQELLHSTVRSLRRLLCWTTVVEKEGSFWLPKQGTSHRKLVTEKQEHIFMATGIKSDWFEGSPQLCVHYLVVTAKSVLYHSCWSRVITAGVPDLPVTGKRSFLFEFACYASLCFSRSWRWVTWNIFLTVQKLEAGVRSCPLSLSTTINRAGMEPAFTTPELGYDFVCLLDNVLSSPVAGWYSFCASAIVKWCWTVILPASWGCTSF